MNVLIPESRVMKERLGWLTLVLLLLMTGPCGQQQLPEGECVTEYKQHDGVTRNNGSNRWTTGDEISFIDSLGLHREKTRSDARYVELLELYIEAAENRSRWGDIEMGKAIDYAKHKLKETRVRLGFTKGDQN